MARALWRVKARAEGRLLKAGLAVRSGSAERSHRVASLAARAHITQALKQSDRPEDWALAREGMRFVNDTPFVSAERAKRGLEVATDRSTQAASVVQRPVQRDALQRSSSDFER